MAKIYSPPASLELPEMSFQQMDTYKARCDKYLEELKNILIAQNKNVDKEGVGEIIRFPVADGYAEYMVASLKPVKLVHLPLMDAYEFQYIERLTAADVRAEIKRQQAIKELFKSKQK